MIKIAYIYRHHHNLSPKGKNGYVGRTLQTPEKRWIEHKSEAFNESRNSYNYTFKRAIRKYGVESFEMDVLEILHNTTKEEVSKREVYWVSYFNSFKQGYNMTTGGECSDAIELTLSEIKSEVSKYKTKVTFIQGSPLHYDSARRQGFYEEVCKNLKQNTLWDEDKILSVASSCKSKTEFSKKHSGADKAAKKLDIMDKVNCLFTLYYPKS